MRRGEAIVYGESVGDGAMMRGKDHDMSAQEQVSQAKTNMGNTEIIVIVVCTAETKPRRGNAEPEMKKRRRTCQSGVCGLTV